MKLFFKNEGPMMAYGNTTLFIHDLNPEQHMTWRVGRLEMFNLGLRCMVAAVFARRSH